MSFRSLIQLIIYSCFHLIDLPVNQLNSKDLLNTFPWIVLGTSDPRKNIAKSFPSWIYTYMMHDD